MIQQDDSGDASWAMYAAAAPEALLEMAKWYEKLPDPEAQLWIQAKQEELLRRLQGLLAGGEWLCSGFRPGAAHPQEIHARLWPLLRIMPGTNEALDEAGIEILDDGRLAWRQTSDSIGPWKHLEFRRAVAFETAKYPGEHVSKKSQRRRLAEWFATKVSANESPRREQDWYELACVEEFHGEVFSKNLFREEWRRLKHPHPLKFGSRPPS